MAGKKKRVHIRRALLAALVLGAGFALKTGGILAWNAVHGWRRPWQLLVMLLLTGALALLAGWFGELEGEMCDRKETKHYDVV